MGHKQNIRKLLSHPSLYFFSFSFIGCNYTAGHLGMKSSTSQHGKKKDVHNARASSVDLTLRPTSSHGYYSLDEDENPSEEANTYAAIVYAANHPIHGSDSADLALRSTSSNGYHSLDEKESEDQETDKKWLEDHIQADNRILYDPVKIFYTQSQQYNTLVKEVPNIEVEEPFCPEVSLADALQEQEGITNNEIELVEGTREHYIKQALYHRKKTLYHKKEAKYHKKEAKYFIEEAYLSRKSKGVLQEKLTEWRKMAEACPHLASGEVNKNPC